MELRDARWPGPGRFSRRGQRAPLAGILRFGGSLAATRRPRTPSHRPREGSGGRSSVVQAASAWTAPWGQVQRVRRAKLRSLSRKVPLQRLRRGCGEPGGPEAPQRMAGVVDTLICAAVAHDIGTAEHRNIGSEPARASAPKRDGPRRAEQRSIARTHNRARHSAPRAEIASLYGTTGDRPPCRGGISRSSRWSRRAALAGRVTQAVRPRTPAGGRQRAGVGGPVLAGGRWRRAGVGRRAVASGRCWSGLGHIIMRPP
jgi:hypothetical protein